MKNKNKKLPYIIGIGVLVIFLLALTVPFFILAGKYNFSAFWEMFFDKIFNLKAFFEAFPLIAERIPATLAATIISAIVGLLLGLLLALIKINKVPVLNQLRALFVSFIRGTPLIVQLYLSYTGIPLILQAINMNYGTNWNVNGVASLFYVILAFGLNEAAYGSETIRSAIESVDTGQIEAAKSLGMTNFQVFKRVTVKEAAAVATAPLGNALIGLLKGTSLAFVVSYVEMTAQAQITGGSTFRFFENYLALALIYWVMCIILEIMIGRVEKWLRIEMKDTRKNRAMISLATSPFNDSGIRTKIEAETDQRKNVSHSSQLEVNDR
ncbi:MAG: amino acid ABC transporter permease [Streptococcaceae bacterium]|jgi:polar amino acid transport system permease protein|nr:amino acid ABC transporter permease [Streptococcaceae bacterium]